MKQAISTVDPTRERIIAAAAEHMRQSGFQSLSLSQLLSDMGMSKGGFYHHFPSKQALGYAVLEEAYATYHKSNWLPVFESDDPIQAIIDLFGAFETELKTQACIQGCPINNLSQEMSLLDEGFRERVTNIYTSWQANLSQAFGRAQKNHKMRLDVSANDVAALVVAGCQGAIGLAKNAQNMSVLSQSGRALIQYLTTLKK